MAACSSARALGGFKAWIVFLTLALALCGCGVVNDLKTMSDAGNAFAAELTKGNTDTAVAMMHSKVLNSGDIKAALKEQFTDHKFGGVKIDSTTISNGIGELTGTCDLANAGGDLKSAALTIQLEKENDQWKVIYVSCKSD